MKLALISISFPSGVVQLPPGRLAVVGLTSGTKEAGASVEVGVSSGDSSGVASDSLGCSD